MAVSNMGVISDDYYQISDDDDDECDDDNLLDELPPAAGEGRRFSSGRGPYERAWTTEATRALIHIRGPMENRFTEGRQKRTALWMQCTRHLQKLGYRYSSGKVQKKWHNILITYNKNLSKKYMTGYVHWEFFEDMFKYLKGKKADCDLQFQQHHQQQQQHKKQLPHHMQLQPTDSEFVSPPDSNGGGAVVFNGREAEHDLLQPKVLLDSKSNDDEFDEDSESVTELKEPKQEYNTSQEMPLEILHNENYEETYGQMPLPNGSLEPEWWRDYFDRKAEMERERLDLQRQMHRDTMLVKKEALQLEREKLEAYHKLTAVLERLVSRTE